MTKAVDVLVEKKSLNYLWSKPISMNFHQRRQNYFQWFSNFTHSRTCATPCRISIRAWLMVLVEVSLLELSLDHAPIFHFLVFLEQHINGEGGGSSGGWGWWKRSSDEVKKQLTERREYFFASYNRKLGELVKCMENIPGGCVLPSLRPTKLIVLFLL